MKQKLLYLCTLLCLLCIGGGNVWGAKTYTKVTYASTLNANDVIILACDTKSTYAGAMGSNAFLTSVSSKNDAIEITLSGNSSGWTLTTSEGEIGATADKKMSKTAGTTTWTISINNGNATIKSTTTSYGSIQYNASSPRFLNYSSSQTAIQIYKVTESGGGITPTTFTVTVANDIANGSVSASTNTAAADTEITLTAIPATGYEFGSWNVTNESTNAAITVTDNKFIMPAADVNVSATFNKTQAGGEPSTEGTWIKCSITDLTSTDVFVIVDAASSNAMTNNNGTGSAPAAKSVTISQDGNTVTGVTDVMKWNIASGTNGYTIYPSGTTDKWLYCTNSNNGVRVGTNSSKFFVIENHTNGVPFLKHNATSRYVGVYEESDWRCYTSINDNIKGTQTRFYKYTEGGSNPGTTTEYKVSINENIDGGTISADPLLAEENASVTLTATPFDGYKFESWSVTTNSGTSINVVNNKFTMPAADVNVSATFTTEREGGEVTPSDVYFQKVTSSHDIVDGGEYIIVYEDNDVTYAAEYISGSSLSKVSVSRTNNVISDIKTASVFKFKLKEDNFYQMILQGLSGNDVYLRGYSGKTDLKPGYSSIDEYDQWSFIVDKNNVVINNKKLTSGSYPRQIRYDINNSKFANYQHTNNEGVTLYKKILPHVTISLNSACHDSENKVFGTFSSSKAWEVPSNITVSEISIIDDELYVEEYKSGAIVPANTGVMVSANEGGDYYANISSNEGTSALGKDNCLRPSGDAGITADVMATADENCTYYRLTMHNGTQIGFWWGAADGAAFSLAANKAYLAVPKSAGVKANGMWFGNTETAIENLMSEKSNSVIYNVAGQRVSKAQKGLYIKDGKKYLVK